MVCQEDLSVASYRGVTFYVSKDAVSYGRRIQTHEYPNRDIPFHEDLGQKNTTIKVTAYVFEPGAAGKAAALTAVCATEGSGILVLPDGTIFNCVCPSAEVSRERDKNGYRSIELEFRVDGAQTGFGAFGVFGRLIDDIGYGLPTLLGAALAPLFQAPRLLGLAGLPAGRGEVPDYVLDATITTLEMAAGDLLVAVEGARLPEPQAQDAVRTLIVASRSAASTFRPLRHNYLPPGTGSRDPLADSIAACLGRMNTVIRQIGQSPDAEVADQTLRTLQGFLGVQTFDRPRAPSEELFNQSVLGFQTAVRQMALVERSRLVAERDYATRRDAIQARADLTEDYNTHLDASRHQEARFRALIQARNTAAQAITRRAINLAPILTIEAPRSMPSLYWAWRLYQDPERAGELVRRNGVQHASLMPQIFEAMAR